MSNLQSALSRIGEVAPERPLPEPVEGGNECDMTNSFANRLGLHVTALESLLLRLAERVERAERNHAPVVGDSACTECDGWGMERCSQCYSLTDKCPRCSGTGKDPR